MANTGTGDRSISIERSVLQITYVLYAEASGDEANPLPIVDGTDLGSSSLWSFFGVLSRGSRLLGCRKRGSTLC